MPAKTRAELLQKTAAEYEKLARIVGSVSDGQALKRDQEDTSIKDVIAHRAHWIDLFLGWYHDGQAGKEVHFPAKSYKWNELKRYNSDLRMKQEHLDWQDACNLLDVRHRQLSDLIESLSEADLYGAPMKGAKNHWTTGRWAEAAGSSHYKSAVKYIRSRLKELH